MKNRVAGSTPILPRSCWRCSYHKNGGRMTRDAPQRTRSCRRDQPAATTTLSRGSRQICLPRDRAPSDGIWEDPQAVRRLVEGLLEQHPEPFLEAMTRGFTWCGTLPPSKKRAGVCLRRLRVTETEEHSHVTTRDDFFRPSFIL